MDKRKKLFEVIIDERESFTSYIYADNEDEVKRTVYEKDIHQRSNQDFEQEIIHVKELEEKDYPQGVLITE